MREILFKAKTCNGEWVEGMPIFDGTDEQWRIVMQLDYSTGTCIQTEYAPRVIAKTICQYTGLTDKNRRKIWENDIVEAWSEGVCAKGKIKHRIDGHWIMYPAWQNGEMWYLLPNENGITTVEVIGNVFDNPELLEKAR